MSKSKTGGNPNMPGVIGKQPKNTSMMMNNSGIPLKGAAGMGMPGMGMPGMGMPGMGMPGMGMPNMGMPGMGMPKGMPGMGMSSMGMPSNPMTNDAKYWEPFSGTVVDTKSGVNSYQVPPIVPHSFYPAISHSEDMVKKFIKQSRHFWLETHWTSLFRYVTVQNKTARLVKSKSEYESEKKNKYDSFEIKADFIREHFCTKKKLKAIIQDFIRLNPIPNDLYDYERVLADHIKHIIKKKLIKRVEKNF